MALTKVTGDFIKDGVLTQAHLHSSHGITTAHIGEGSNLYFTNARAREAISVSGNALSYNSSTGVITANYEESPTFTGDVSYSGTLISTGSTTVPAYFRSTASVSYIQLQNSTTGTSGTSDGLTVGVNGNNAYVWSRENASLLLGTNDTTALTLDNSQNATFVGDITVSGGDITLGGTGRIQGIDTVSANTDAANKLYVDNQVAGIVDSAPSTLDTLNELAAALGDDANFSTTVSNNIASKLPLAGGTLTGVLTGVGIKTPYVETTTTNQSLFLRPNGTGHLYIGDSGNGSNIYHYSAANDGVYTSFSYSGNYYQIDTTATSGIKILDNVTTPTVQISNGNSYNENIRMFPGSNDYSSLVLGAVSGTSGAGVGQWTLVRYPATTHSNKFTIRHNGTDHVTIGTAGNVTNHVDTRSPIFYDSNDTSYYVNPASGSNMFTLDLNAGTVWDATTQGTTKGALHLDPNSSTDHAGAAITFGASDTSSGTTAQGGIYVRTDGTYGTKMYFSTTDSYATGSKTAMNILHNGQVNITRSNLIVNTDVRAPIFYDSNNTARYIDPASTSSINGLSVNGQLSMLSNNIIVFGPNSGWSKELAIGGNANNSTSSRGSIGVTNGNLHIDAADGGYATYLNYYDGTGGVAFGSGASAAVAWMGPDGDLWKGSADNTGYRYWHAANDGAGSTLDADLLDGLHASSFLQTTGSFGDFTGTNTALNARNGASGVAIGNYTSAYAYIDLASTNSTFGSWIDFSKGDGQDYGGRIRYHNSNNTFTFTTGGTNDEFVIYTTYTYSPGSSRAPIFYDSDDTSYIVDPNSVTRLSGLKLEPASSTNQASGDDNVLWIHRVNNNDWGIQINADQGSATDYGYEFLGGSSHTYAFSGVAAGTRYFNVGSSYAQHDGSFRAPIFYDSNDTGYYVNPNGTSNLYNIETKYYGETGTGVPNYDEGGIEVITNSNGVPAIGFHRGGYSATTLYEYDGELYVNPWTTRAQSGKLISTGNIHNTIYSGSWMGANFAGTRFAGYSTDGGEIAFLKNNPVSGKNSILVDGSYYSGENGGFWSIWSGNNYNNRVGIYGDTSGNLQIGTSTSENVLRTNYGYIQMGPMNSSHAHIYTDRSNFYFNKQIQLLGSSQINQNDIRSQIFYDLNDTSYYFEGNGTSRFHSIWCRGAAVNSAPRWDTSFHVAQSQHFYGHSSTQTLYFGEAGNTYQFPGNGGIRSQIFYDYNDTSYYIDPNSTSRSGLFRSYLTFNDYGAGVVGSYSSYKYQLVFAMGEAYKGALDGSNVTGGYGLWYSHPNAGGVAANLNSHGLMNIDNGNWQASFAGSTRAAIDMRAPIFYDQNNTGYYMDPASTSFISNLTMNGNIEIRRQDPTIYFRDTNHNSAMLHTNSNIFYILRGGNDTTSWATVNGYWPLEINLTNNQATFGGMVQAINDMRATLFYDRANTAYYCDPGSTSKLSVVEVGASGYSNIWLGGQSGNYFRFHTNNSHTYFDGNVGDIHWRQGSSTRFIFYMTTANMTVNGTVTQYSDSRLKENIMTIDGALDKVNQLRGVYYNRTDINTSERQIGLVAQEVESVVPEIVHTADDELNTKSISYAQLNALLVEAIKEQQTIIDDLKSRIETLENQ